jgi:hypothetical protein
MALIGLIDDRAGSESTLVSSEHEQQCFNTLCGWSMMSTLQVRRWIVALMAGGGMAANAPAGAEVIYAASDIARPRVTVADSTMRMQLCARKDVSGYCLDGETSAKARQLLPSAPSDAPLPVEPPVIGDPPPVITLQPPVIDELPSVREAAPLLPIAAAPSSIAVPEPGSLSLAALGALMLVTVLRMKRQRS